MAKKKNNSFGGANSFGKFKGSAFGGGTPKIETYKVEPIEGVFGGSVPNSIYTIDRESTWSRWRRGWELGSANISNTAYQYPFENIPTPLFVCSRWKLPAWYSLQTFRRSL